MDATQDFNHIWWYILLFLQTPGYFYSKHYVYIEVKLR